MQRLFVYARERCLILIFDIERERGSIFDRV